MQPDDNALRVAAQRLKFDDIDGCKEAIAIYPGNEPEDIAKKAVLAAFYDADEAEELVNQLPQDLVPQVDEEMTQEDVDKLLEAGVPKAWRTSRRENLNPCCAGQNARGTGRGEGQEAGRRPEAAEEAPGSVPGQAPERGQVRPQEPEAAGSRALDREEAAKLQQAPAAKTRASSRGPRAATSASKDAQKLDAKSRADERKAKDEKAKAERDAAIAAGLSGKKKRTGNRKRRGN